MLPNWLQDDFRKTSDIYTTRKSSWRWQSMPTIAPIRRKNKLQKSERLVWSNAEAVARQGHGEWYWRMLLENSLFSPTRTCLTPHSEWTLCDINVTYKSLKSAFNGLQFRRWQYRSIFIRLPVNASETRKMSRNSKRIWPYSSSRSSKVIDVGVNGKHVTSC